ncbi:hypothetical protein PSEUDO8BK_10536 [Pseudomonas sp. 8BK]|nr:hypothetical protein PSEUDO8BK_10536 [Pseudomonas sp. 8BK]
MGLAQPFVAEKIPSQLMAQIYCALAAVAASVDSIPRQQPCFATPTAVPVRHVHEPTTYW